VTAPSTPRPIWLIVAFSIGLGFAVAKMFACAPVDDVELAAQELASDPMPYEIEITPAPVTGLRTDGSMWLRDLWGRTRDIGNWYRAVAPAATYSYYVLPFAGAPASCTVGWAGATCWSGTQRADIVCPLYMGWAARNWRPEPGAPGERWSTQWAAFAERVRMPLIAVIVPSNDRGRVDCKYRTLEPNGWSYVDVWVERRPFALLDPWN
jgi:hypothetical protein